MSELFQRSPVCDVHLLGFRSDTVMLQRAGWELAVEQSPNWHSARLAIRHPGAGFFGVSREVEQEDLLRNGHPAMYRPGGGWRPCFVIEQLLPGNVNFTMARLPEPVHMLAIDARPSWEPIATVLRISGDEWVKQVFMPAVPDTKEIIVGPQTVDEALQLILEMQRDDQASLREKARKRGRQVHAQIVSLAA